MEVFRDLCETYYAPFSNARFTPEQEACMEQLQQYIEPLFYKKSRERYLNELVLCCTGYAEEDSEEMVDPTTFSQYQFYEAYTKRLVDFTDKFDFLIMCLYHNVCIVHQRHTERFLKLLHAILTFGLVAGEGGGDKILDLSSSETPRIVGEVEVSEEERIEWLHNFLNKKNWPDYKNELKELEKEQEQWEKDEELRSGPPVFDWQCTDAPDIKPMTAYQ
eukprot:TRINITY_DN12458_c0_g1_i1.p1 TRINITY_DN12458_c0_g1~~TRINITY_DN12458_c0_g1_i1.p1  ORF type:complete len:219 (+),score=24.36 TRINITY_DN12458_c0_g1_i1:76-732(+)